VGTELVTFYNDHGKRLVGFHDYPISLTAPDKKWVIVLPGYGETKTDVLTQSYFLARNGFQTLRFDYSDHVGESEGDIAFTTLERMKGDIVAAIDYVYRRDQVDSVGAVARSLAVRALIRAARDDDRLAFLVSLMGVVDLRKTLLAIYQEDYVESVMNGLCVGVMDVLGFQVDADNFLRSAIENSYEDLKTTIEDVRRIRAPIAFFAAEKDVWVELQDVRQIVYAVSGKRRDFQILNGALHELHENPRLAHKVLKEVVRYCQYYSLKNSDVSAIKKPSSKELGPRIRKEKERNKLLHVVSKREEREFWKSYLDKYSFVVNVYDYWNLMELICELLGKLNSHDRVLDVGCGTGNYGTFLFLKLLYRLKHQSVSPREYPLVRYVGLDWVKEAALMAAKIHSDVKREFGPTAALIADGHPFRASYMLADLDSAIPLKANTFDKICCNLVVSYLQKPAGAISELVRVLKPNGKIVVSSLKPFADLSEVYRNFVNVAHSKHDIEEARKLLSNAGRVKAKEAEGVYEFFSEEQLVDLLRNRGVHDIEVYRSFGNQANVAVGRKE
jgi:SAM-dependent methyltransferase/esterase/lipase